MSKVLILYTGGTIGMLPSAQGYAPAGGFARRLTERLGENRADLPAWDLIERERLIDSANLQPADWLAIGQELVRYREQYDGFVVLHGTDTMAHTASALSFMLRGFNKPVILTGAQIPLCETRNDALDNLVTSLMIAGQYPVPEVCICFHGKLLRGNRSVKLDSMALAAFASPNFPVLGEAGIQVRIHSERLLQPATPDFRLPDFNPEAVTLLPVYPGLSVRVLDALLDSDQVRALILLTYGAGNPPDANRALMQRLERAGADGIVIVNLTQCLQGRVEQGAYATGAALNRIGVLPGADLTFEAAFAKLHCLLAGGFGPEQVREQLLLPWCGECC
ncbi:MAG: asparaginase [Thiothrix sp.]|nr:asparaginase [Thiothrix sp.]HPE60340.1 asparaginase domain-containing protein [Thiolinea sp.]